MQNSIFLFSFQIRTQRMLIRNNNTSWNCIIQYYMHLRFKCTAFSWMTTWCSDNSVKRKGSEVLHLGRDKFILSQSNQSSISSEFSNQTPWNYGQQFAIRLLEYIVYSHISINVIRLNHIQLDFLTFYLYKGLEWLELEFSPDKLKVWKEVHF